MHVSHAAVCLCTRHLTEQECQEIWCFGTNGKTFLNAVSEARVAQIARSYGCTPLAAWLLDCVFTGLLHPPGFKCLPTANAPSAQAEESADWPEWARGLVEDVVGVDGAEDCAAATSRKVDIMEAVCVVSLGGAAKTHLLEFFCKLVQQLDAPQALYVKGVPPIRRQVGNFSALAIMAKQHGKIVYCPDEWGLAVHPARGTTPKGTSTSQMMSMQACVVDFVLVMKECVHVVSRAISDPCCLRAQRR